MTTPHPHLLSTPTPPATAHSHSGLRVACGLVVGVAGAQVALTYFHLPGWPCPFHALTGLPCPGCGLTRATVACLHGDMVAAMRWHAFGPLLLLMLLLAVVFLILPARPRTHVARHLLHLQRQSWPGWLVVSLLGIYWILRLLGWFALPQG